MSGEEQNELNFKEQLFDAAKNGNLKSAKDAINNDALDSSSYTPLHWAAYEDNLDNAVFLHNNGANIDAPDRSGHTPLHLAALLGHLGIVKFLICEGAKIDATDKYGRTTLHLAVLGGNLDVVKFLINKDAGINVENAFGSTPLHLATSKDIAECLITGGADVKAQGMCGLTPLHLAARRGHLDVVKCLLSKGADVHAGYRSSKTPLYEAAVKGNLNVAKFLSEKVVGFTPLHWEALAGNLNIVKSLISDGADINVEDEYGCTPLHWAALANRRDVVELLISKGADINAKNKNGCTPLHLAARAGKLNVVKCLINNGADINAKNKNGFIPLRWAALTGHNLDVAEFLIKHTLLQDPKQCTAQPYFYHEKFNTYWTKCTEELRKLEQENPGLFNFLYAKSFKEGVKIWAQNKSMLEDEALLKEQYPECADMFINIFTDKATQCESVTSFGQFIAKHYVAFQIVSGLLLAGVVASCVYGFPFAAISFLIAGAFVFGPSTDIGWEACERVSSKFNSTDIAQPAQTIEVS